MTPLKAVVWCAALLFIASVGAPMVGLAVRVFVVGTAEQPWPPAVWEALFMSAVLAIIVSFLAASLGALLGILYAAAGISRAAAVLLALALIVPDVPAAEALRQTLQTFGLHTTGFWQVLMGQLWFPLAMTSLLVYLRLRAMRIDSVVATARQLGARPAHVLGLTARMGWPAAAIGGLVAFAYSLQDVIYPLFLGSALNPVLPALVYSSARFGLQSWMLLYGTVVFLLGGLLSAWFITREITYGDS